MPLRRRLRRSNGLPEPLHLRVGRGRDPSLFLERLIMDYMEEIKEMTPEEAWIVSAFSLKLTKAADDKFFLDKEAAKIHAWHLNRMYSMDGWKPRRVLVFVLE